MEGALAHRLPDVLIEHADLHELVGNYDPALELYREARELVPRDVRTWRGIAATLRKQGEYEAALATIDDAFSTDALASADVAPLWVESGWTLLLAGRSAQAVDVLEAGLEAAAGRKDPVVGQLLLRLARAETVEGSLDQALQHGQSAEAILGEHGDLRAMATAYRVVGDILRQQGKLREARDVLERGLALAGRVGNAEELAGSLMNLATVEYFAGDVASAVDRQQAAVAEFERVGHVSGRAQAYSNLGWLLLEAGRLSEAHDACDRARELAQRVGHAVTLAEVAHTVAAIKAAQGEFDTAAASAEDAARLFAEIGSKNQAVEAFEMAARAHEQGGHEAQARLLREQARTLRKT